jgi:hypothetical protein
MRNYQFFYIHDIDHFVLILYLKLGYSYYVSSSTDLSEV